MFGLPITNFIHPDTRDNNIVGYNYLQSVLLLQVLEELKKLNANLEKEDTKKTTTKKEEVKEEKTPKK